MEGESDREERDVSDREGEDDGGMAEFRRWVEERIERTNPSRPLKTRSSPSFRMTSPRPNTGSSPYKLVGVSGVRGPTESVPLLDVSVDAEDPGDGDRMATADGYPSLEVVRVEVGGTPP